MTENVINYKPAPTIKQFMKNYRHGQLFYDWIVGPVGSSKTTGLFFKLIYMAKLQKPSPDGIRRSRAVIVRNTAPQLRDTTLVSWGYWFKHGVAGEWKETAKTFILRFGDVECEVLFRPLDTPEDVARVLSLEVTFAILDEFVQIPREIVQALSARLGRYPSMKDGGATNWGMWGASNPDTEDNWWFDYLHDEAVVERITGALTVEAQRAKDTMAPDLRNVRYYHQPSGFSPDAENLENLPGGRDYYVNQAIGKTKAWIKQFIEAEWGFSVSGQPVIAAFDADLHVAKSKLLFNPQLPLIIGYDPGMSGSAMIFGQEDLHGRLLVFAELIQAQYSTERLISEKLQPFLRAKFPDARVIIAPDPAAANRAQSDAKSVVDTLKKHFTVSVESNNRFPLRLNAIEYYATRLTSQGPALQIDGKECPILVRALKGGWKYAMDKKHGVVNALEPEKNMYSHPGDGFGYLCRFLHKAADRAGRYTAAGVAQFKPPRSFSPGYHIR